MFHGFNTSVSPESSEEVWGGLGSSREVWGATGSYGELRRGLEVWGAYRALTGPGPGSHSKTSGFGCPKPEKPDKIRNIITNML